VLILKHAMNNVSLTNSKCNTDTNSD